MYRLSIPSMAVSTQKPEAEKNLKKTLKKMLRAVKKKHRTRKPDPVSRLDPQSSPLWNVDSRSAKTSRSPPGWSLVNASYACVGLYSSSLFLLSKKEKGPPEYPKDMEFWKTSRKYEHNTQGRMVSGTVHHEICSFIESTPTPWR